MSQTAITETIERRICGRRTGAAVRERHPGVPSLRNSTLQLRAMAVEFPVVHGHPNRLPFEGVLTLVDVPSDRAPSGARGHRVILTRAAAETALPSLLGMAVDYKAGWDGHDARQKCGIITGAQVDGTKLTVSGYLFARDFPEMEPHISGRKPLFFNWKRHLDRSGGQFHRPSRSGETPRIGICGCCRLILFPYPPRLCLLRWWVCHSLRSTRKEVPYPSPQRRTRLRLYRAKE